MLVELSEVGYEVFNDVGMGEWVDTGLLARVGWNAACDICECVQLEPLVCQDLHKHARVLTPSIFMAQLPQMPSLQDRLKVKVGSTSFLILIKASSIMGPVLFRSSV